MVQIKASRVKISNAIFLLLWVGLALFILAKPIFMLAEPVFAQEATRQANTELENSERIQKQLQEIKNSIELNSNDIKNLEKEIARLDGDRTKQSAALIAAAQRVTLAEIEADAIEENLKKLLTQQNQIKNRLDGTNVEIANILAALQRIGRSPAPALIVNAGDALNSARSAMLISAILPQLRREAKTVRDDLLALLKIVEQAQTEEDLFARRLQELAQERLRIVSLLESREKQVDIANEQLIKKTKSAKEMADEAKSLEELLKALANNSSEPVDLNNNANSTNSDIISTAFANMDRNKPAIPFSQSMGYLEMPAAGVIIRKFMDNDNLGGKAKGISIITRAQAQVVAPSDGWVLFKGDYLNYGQIIIIDPGDGYTILLAGLDSVNVEIGQFILRQEPIGIMGERTIALGVNTNASKSRPTLYIELRKQDIPIDPSKWWRIANRQTQSG